MGAQEGAYQDVGYLPAWFELLEGRGHICLMDPEIFFFFYLGLNGWVGISQVEKGEEHSIQKEQPQA